MDNKRQSDYKDLEEYPFPSAMHNKDPLRKSIRSATDREQVAVWGQICESFEVCGLKNGFAVSDEQVGLKGVRMVQSDTPATRNSQLLLVVEFVCRGGVDVRGCVRASAGPCTKANR